MEKKRIHMIGIGGIGMSALAQLLVHQGHRVSGSDRSSSPVTDLLIKKGVAVTVGHDASCVSSDTDVVVYSSAVPVDNPERVRAQALGIREMLYFEALGEATKDGTSIVITGTHGKTTTTAMLAKVLVDCGKDPTVICGSVMSEFGSNFRAGRSDLFVIEGCEYRRHFLHLRPKVLVINNIELDHTDYYHDRADIECAFGEMAKRVTEGGVIVADMSSESVTHALVGVRMPIVPFQEVSVPHLRTPGAFNLANARAAKTAALAFDPRLNEDNIDRALADFRGTWRRFEYKGTTKGGAMVYDDYAHHPTAIRGTLTMVREEFPSKSVVVVFHPHLYSRTRDFMDEFASALAVADEVLLAPIFAAREDSIEGVTSGVLAEKVTALGTPARAFRSLEDVTSYLTTTYHLPPTTLLVTMGAGDIYHVAEALVSKQ